MRNTLLPAACLVLLAFVPTHPARAQGTPAGSAAPAAAASLDFGDFSSAAITNKAWGALSARRYEDAIAYTSKCIEMFKGKAVEMQKALNAAPTDKDQTFAQWALNDVGTCYYIQAKAYEGKAQPKEALADYQLLSDHLGYAQCWDPKGWFWKPAEAAKERLQDARNSSLK